MSVDGGAGVEMTYQGQTILIAEVSATDLGVEDFIVP
ncbi:hypothetical protein SAMN04515678_12232 [Roseivivax sediminis]|uniref:Uncharacterized protein n=1 Tax=Roseivivax sediminis TaxID=936889 RepID=A0A1I2EES0_9RHOB|nr:hypothetical protein SAMN04515678_12232 [Roseivivax sediminis]